MVYKVVMKVNGIKTANITPNGSNSPSFSGANKPLAGAKLLTNLAKGAIEQGDKLNVPKWAEKMGGAKWFDSVIRAVDKNEAIYEAAAALVVAGVLKPMCVLAMPGAEMEDKQMAATKNTVSAVIGFGVSNLLLSPFSNAVNRISSSIESQNPTKYIKDAKFVKTLQNEEVLPGLKSTMADSFKTTFKKMPDMAVSPLKAGLTISLTPVVLAILFGKKKDKKGVQETSNPTDTMTVMNSIRADKENKKAEKSGNQPSFTGSLNDTEKSGNQPSFTGALGNAKKAYDDFLGEPIAKLIGKFAPTKVGQGLVRTAAKFEKPAARWSDMASIAITYFYVNNTRKSEKIEEDRKLPLIVNNIMVTAASSAAAFLIDKYTDKPVEHLLSGYMKKHGSEMFQKSNGSVIENVKKGINNASDFDLKNMTKHSAELLSGGVENLSDVAKTGIKELQNNDVIKEGIKKGLFKSDDVAKMALSGFEKYAGKINKNISKAKSLTVFTLTVRFLVTVLMTPVIGKVVEFIKNKTNNDDKTPKNTVPKDMIPPAGSETLGMKDFIGSLNK